MIIVRINICVINGAFGFGAASCGLPFDPLLGQGRTLQSCFRNTKGLQPNFYLRKQL